MYEMTWETLGNISTVIGLAGSGFALCAWLQAKAITLNTRREKERLNQEVNIILKGEDGQHIITFPFALRRRELTRSEVLGLVGMLPMTPKKGRERYKIHFLSTPRFRKILSEVQDADDKFQLIIECTNAEIDQFDRDKIKI